MFYGTTMAMDDTLRATGDTLLWLSRYPVGSR